MKFFVFEEFFLMKTLRYKTLQRLKSPKAPYLFTKILNNMCSCGNLVLPIILVPKYEYRNTRKYTVDQLKCTSFDRQQVIVLDALYKVFSQ